MYGYCLAGLAVHNGANSDEERRFMYKIKQSHLTVFCIVFVWLGGPPSPVRIMTQVPWFMYQNRLGPSGGIYYLNFVPCFVVLYLNGRPGGCNLKINKMTPIESVQHSKPLWDDQRPGFYGKLFYEEPERTEKIPIIVGSSLSTVTACGPTQ